MKAIILLAGLISVSAFADKHKEAEKPKEKVKVEQPMCGVTRICEMKKDKKGNPYCVCQGRKGRAKLECCKEKKAGYY